MDRALLGRILLLALWSSPAIPAQEREDLEVLYQRAVHQEVVEGDLEQALELYRQVTVLTGVSRSTAARALLRMGQCLEKLGRTDASRIYLRILNEYGDQPGVAHQARLKLERKGILRDFPMVGRERISGLLNRKQRRRQTGPPGSNSRILLPLQLWRESALSRASKPSKKDPPGQKTCIHPLSFGNAGNSQSGTANAGTSSQRSTIS